MESPPSHTEWLPNSSVTTLLASQGPTQPLMVK
jgi:hypothetical protein